MFDACPTQARFDPLKRIRRFFLCHGTEFAQAVSRLGGAPATQRLASCVAGSSQSGALTTISGGS